MYIDKLQSYYDNDLDHLYTKDAFNDAGYWEDDPYQDLIAEITNGFKEKYYPITKETDLAAMFKDIKFYFLVDKYNTKYISAHSWVHPGSEPRLIPWDDIELVSR
jgi:hypothetical protein